jgi:hypothetical protein
MNLNLILAWIGILLGFLSGFCLGLKFHQPDWLGGYGSFKRRMYRLAHISLFGLAVVNLLFYFTARSLGAAGLSLEIASGGFILGAITMPACCLITAHFPACRTSFAVPVLSLLLAGTLTLWAVIKTPNVTTHSSAVRSPLKEERAGVRGESGQWRAAELSPLDTTTDH